MSNLLVSGRPVIALLSVKVFMIARYCRSTFHLFVYCFQDSAAWYENEKEVGQAILDFCQSTGTPRSEIFYTTKLKENNGYDRTKLAIQRSLDICGLGYIDLYLIHGPLGGPHARKESWRAICDFKEETGGLLKSIGISTFGIRHMKDILDAGMPIPAVHQVGQLAALFWRNFPLKLCLSD